MIYYAHSFQDGLKVFDTLPDIHSLKNCFYIPRSTGPHDRHYGIYDQYGRLVSSAGPRRGWPNHSLGQEESSCVSPSPAFPAAPEECYLYGGHVGAHFGHFITETLPRYWYDRHAYPGLKILVHSAEPLSYLFGIPWLADFFHLLGIEEEDIVRFERPTRIKQLIVPGTAFEENHFVHRVFSQFCSRLSHNIPTSLPADNRPVFLSRAHYKNGLRIIEREDRLTEILEEQGFRIISPETLPISEQIQLFSHKRPVIGFIGSAFHNSIFSNSPFGFALTCDEEYSNNFYLMDQVSNARIAYLQCPHLSHLPQQQGSHQRHFRIEDPETLARQIVLLTQNRIWEQTEPPPAIPGGFDWEQRFYIRTHHGTYLQASQQTGLVFHGHDENGATRIQAVLSRHNGICLSTPSRLCLSIRHNPDQGSKLYYEASVAISGHMTIRHYQHRRILSACPDGSLEGNRLHVQDWEHFTLEAIHTTS